MVYESIFIIDHIKGIQLFSYKTKGQIVVTH